MLKSSFNLKAHYNRLQATLANLREAVVVADAAGGVIFMNAAAQALTGWELLIAQGRAVEEVVRLVAGRDIRPAPRGAVGVAWPMAQSFDLTGHYLANALKHAFRSGGPGAIEVTFLSDRLGSCVLHVRDDGVGFPAGLDFRQADTLGLQLVCLLVEQLGGTIEMTNGPGTHWSLTFPVTTPDQW